MHSCLSQGQKREIKRRQPHPGFKLGSSIPVQLTITVTLRRCPWCNGYRRREWTQRHEFKSWTRLVAFHIALLALGKGMNPITLPPAMGK